MIASRYVCSQIQTFFQTRKLSKLTTMFFGKFILTLFASTSFVATELDQKISDTFICEVGNKLVNVVVHETHGWVYLGCMSYIQRFSLDMKKLEKYSLCTSDSIEGKNCDFIVLLEMDYKNHHLISCSSQGHCLAHSEENISKIISHEVEPVLEVKENVLRTFKFFIRQTNAETFATDINGYGFINKNDILTTFVGVTLSPTFSTPFSVLYISNWSIVSLRSLNPNAFGLLLGQVDICTKATRKIVHGFSWGNLAYFLTINETFHSHIVRIDYQNGTYSCDYVAIVCTRSESETHREFRAAVTAFAFASTSTAKDPLFGIFQSMDTYKVAEEYVICMCSMNEINDMFAIQSILKSNRQYVETIVLKVQSLHYVSNYNDVEAPASIIAVDLINNHYVLFIRSFYCHFVKISISRLSHRVLLSKYDNIFDSCDYSSITHFYGTAMWLYRRNGLNRLYKIQLHNCHQHNTSVTCLKIQDPYCGWCFSTSKCCLKSECSNNGISTNWVSYDIDTYIALSNMPNDLIEQTIQTNVTLAFTSSLPFANHTIIFCIFNLNDSFALKTTAFNCNNSNIINCTIPDSSFFPWKLSYMHYTKAQLSLATNDFPKFVQNIPLVFYNCQTYKTCAACLASNYPCYWNMYENKCVHESGWNNNNTFVIDNYNGNNTKSHQYEYNRNPKFCPAFKRLGDTMSEIVIPADLANYSEPVVEVSISIPEMLKDQNFTCNFILTDTGTNTSREILVDATKSHTNVLADVFNCILTCLIEKLVNNIEKAVTKVELEISSQGGRTYLHNDDRLRLKVLSCARMGNHCKKCIRHQCGWCAAVEKCSEQLLCTHFWIREKHECNASYGIVDFEPQQSPVDGGTSIVIYTQNPITDFITFNCSVTVSGVLCNIDRHVAAQYDTPIYGFYCIVQQFDPTIHYFRGPIIVNCSTGISTSKNNFTFFDPQVNHIIPKNGPKCGGTKVTIYGEHLNMSSTTEVFFDDLECVVIATYSDRLQCITSPSRRSFTSKVMVSFDSHNSNRTKANITFHYDENMRADDAIHRVPRGITAGGIDIYVLGENLTSYGKVALGVDTQQIIGEGFVLSLCEIINTTFMICPSPKLEIFELSMDTNSEKRPRKLSYSFIEPITYEPQDVPMSYPIPKLYPKFLLYPNSLQNIILEISETHWLIENVPLVIIGTVMAVALVLAIVVLKFRRMAKISRNMQQQINKMGLETIAMSQWIKRVVIEKHIQLDENEQIMLKLPNVTIEPTTVPRVTDDQILQEIEYELPPDNVWEFDRSNLTFGKCLGQGEFGIVVKGKATGIVEQYLVTTVAVKMLKSIHTDIDMVCLVSEMELMKLIARQRHDNVLRLLGCCTQNGPLLVITEYAQYGNLLDFLRKHEFATTDEVMPGQLNNKMMISFALQVAKGMHHLASIRCIHRDLAARNILIADNYTMKISDFGLARDVRGKYYYQQKSNARVPVKWMAPEAIHRGRNTTMSDIWSYGILFWEIVTLGSVPYSSFVDVNKLLQAIKSGYRLEKPQNCSMEMYEVMRRCWNNQPEDRPTFAEIVILLDEMLRNAEVCEPEEILLE